MRKLLAVLGGAAVIGTALFAGFGSASGADHADAPLAKANHALDLADVYAFAGSNGNVVLGITVNGLAMPGDQPVFETKTQGGLYQIKIDNNGDAVPDISFNITFTTNQSDATGQTQDVVVRKAVGAQADSLSDGGEVFMEGTTTSAGQPPAVSHNFTNDSLFAGLRDDPFFFDLDAFKAGLKFRNPGVNFFAGLNVSAIVLEVSPEEIMGGPQGGKGTAAGVWAVTSKDDSTNGADQRQVIDRMGRPAVATVFIPADQKDAFNNTKPADDLAKWKSTLVAKLQSLNSSPALADALLPDILTFDTSKPFGFLNGRKLTDDVIDAELQLITGSPAASDFVDNDSTFLSVFPYIGAPNTQAVAAPTAAPAPTTAPPPVVPTRPTGPIAPPNTGTGDGTSGGNSMLVWLALGIAGVAVVATGGAVAARRGR